MANGTLAASQIEMLSQSGTGIITITPPATNTNRAITLPDAAGAIVVSGTTPSLNGITFPATQVPSADANTLDDYEEGSWTPTVSGSSTAGTGTYNAQVGRYTKIGNTVTVSAYINLASHTGSGNTTLTNLPFTILNSGDLYSSISIGYLNNLALTATNIATGVGVFNSTKIDVYQYPIGGGAVSNVAFDAAFTIMYSLTYFTAT